MLDPRTTPLPTSPTQSLDEACITFGDSGNTYPIEDDIPHEDIFWAGDVPYLAEVEDFYSTCENPF